MMAGPPFIERKGYAADAALSAIRKAIADAQAAGVWATSPAASTVDLDGVRALVLAPPAGTAIRGTVLHFHGGGYRIGCPEMMGPFASMLAARCAVDVICPEYRLAPEYPFPAAINDAWQAWLSLRRARNGPIIISGDSAGGGVAAGLTALCGQHDETPAGLVLLSPWLDLSLASPSYDANAHSDPLFSRAQATAGAEAYLQGHDPCDPVVSPIHGDVANHPPTLISVGSGEVLDRDSERMRAALVQAAVPVCFSCIDGMEHVAVTRGLERVGAEKTFALVAEFIDGLLGPPASGI